MIIPPSQVWFSSAIQLGLRIRVLPRHTTGRPCMRPEEWGTPKDIVSEEIENMCHAGRDSMETDTTVYPTPRTPHSNTNPSEPHAQQHAVAVLPSLVRLTTSDPVVTFCSAAPSTIVNPSSETPPHLAAPPPAALAAGLAAQQGGASPLPAAAAAAGSAAMHGAIGDACGDASMQLMHRSMLSQYSPHYVLSQNLAAAAEAAHHADGGMCAMVLVPIVAEFLVSEFGSASPHMLPEACSTFPGMLFEKYKNPINPKPQPVSEKLLMPHSHITSAQLTVPRAYF